MTGESSAKSGEIMNELHCRTPHLFYRCTSDINTPLIPIDHGIFEGILENLFHPLCIVLHRVPIFPDKLAFY